MMSQPLPGWEALTTALRADAVTKARVLKLTLARYPILDLEPQRAAA